MKKNKYITHKIYQKQINIPKIFLLKGYSSKSSTLQYMLCGVITHTGTNVHNGHYVAYT